MTPKSVGFKVGLATALLHFALVVLAYISAAGSQSSTAGLAFLPFLFLDAPLLLLAELLPGGAGKLVLGVPLISFGILGSLMWFAIPWLTDSLLVRFRPQARRGMRWLMAVGSLPVALFLFVPLSSGVIRLSIRNERPDELVALLKRPAPSALARRTAWEDPALRGVCGIHLADNGPEAGVEILVACHCGVVRLDDQCAETFRLEFPEVYYQTVVPVPAGNSIANRFLVYKFFDHAALLDPDGRELWRAGEKTDEGRPLAGVECGDMDGDGQPEFALYRTYRDGITLLDEAGKPRWTHPVYALGHLVMADVRGNGKQEILYSNGGFTTLDADGNVAGELKLDSDSSAFALVDWPERKDRPNLLLTEDNLIRIVDLDGNEVRRLDAPGCRSYGDVAAVPVKFRADESAWLAVRKNVHPDLAVLFVYDAAGQLVHQDVEIRQGGSGTPALAGVPAADGQTERLLVGGGEDGAARLVEYALSGP